MTRGKKGGMGELLNGPNLIFNPITNLITKTIQKAHMAAAIENYSEAINLYDRVIISSSAYAKNKAYYMGLATLCRMAHNYSADSLHMYLEKYITLIPSFGHSEIHKLLIRFIEPYKNTNVQEFSDMLDECDYLDIRSVNLLWKIRLNLIEREKGMDQIGDDSD